MVASFVLLFGTGDIGKKSDANVQLLVLLMSDLEFGNFMTIWVH